MARLRTAVVLALVGVAAAAPGGGARAAAAPCTAWHQRTVVSGLGILANLEFDRVGGLFLSASQSQAIERLTPDGHVTTVVPNVNGPGGERLRGKVLYFNTGDVPQSGSGNLKDGTIDTYDLRTHKRRTWATGLTMPNGLNFLPDGSAVVSRDIGSGTGVTRVPARHPRHPQYEWARLDDTNGLAVDRARRWLYVDRTFAESAIYRIRINNPGRIKLVAHVPQGQLPNTLDDMTFGADGLLYVAGNLAGNIVRVDPRSGASCVIASGLGNPSSPKFGRGPGWPSNRLYVTGFDGSVTELTPPPGAYRPIHHRKHHRHRRHRED